MEGNNLSSEEIVSWGNISRNSNIYTSLVSNQTINTPYSVGISIFVNLEPDISRSSGRFS
jgi:hypothetical protein